MSNSLFPANLGHQQSQFRFDNECNISLPDNHKRVSDAPALDLDKPLPDPDTLVPYDPVDPKYPKVVDSNDRNDEINDSHEDLHNPITPEEPKYFQSPVEGPRGLEEREDGACVVVKEDRTPRGLRLADEARHVAAAHASMLVDIEACKRVSMAVLALDFIFMCIFAFVLYAVEGFVVYIDKFACIFFVYQTCLDGKVEKSTFSFPVHYYLSPLLFPLSTIPR